MRFWVGITDGNWFDQLRERQLDEVNFWQPSAAPLPHLLAPGIPFLFKLRAPRNVIAGGGFFVRATTLPIRVAWEAFGEGNGVQSFTEFRGRIAQLAGALTGGDSAIACNVLTQPFFLAEDQWIPVPASWHPNIQRGKSYDTGEPDGLRLWMDVRARLAGSPAATELTIGDEVRGTRYYLAQARVGQGAFRCLVTDAYGRRCAVTGERTLPVLDAAHIRPYKEQGPNIAANGILLRKDIHKLFDDGYLTITDDLKLKVSGRIREEFENGRHYYDHDGGSIAKPVQVEDLPDREFLRWHREHVYENWSTG